MIIKKLTSLKVSTVEAVAIQDKRTENLYFNIKHGSIGKELFMWWCGLAKKHFSPATADEKLALTGDEYILRPVRVGGELQYNKLNNLNYVLTLDAMEYHKTDVILFWEIPNKNYTDVSYTIDGDHNVIGTGTIGRERSGKLYTSPAPIIELYSSATLTWTGKTSNGEKVSQVITYDMSKGIWDINPIKTEEL